MKSHWIAIQTSPKESDLWYVNLDAVTDFCYYSQKNATEINILGESSSRIFPGDLTQQLINALTEGDKTNQ